MNIRSLSNTHIPSPLESVTKRCARAKMDAWKAAVVLVQSLRQYAFLPVLLMMVPMVV
eukprot:COSAG06_NODE_67279_length_252_cov_0.718954_2_plen_57_part_01